MDQSKKANKCDRAAQFWDQYDPPCEFETGIKVVRSGLLRGSSGSGHNASTVVHAYPLEEFSAGRLSREPHELLCEPKKIHDGRGERHVEDGETYKPEVTCSTCLERMERWEVD